MATLTRFLKNETKCLLLVASLRLFHSTLCKYFSQMRKQAALIFANY